VIVSSLRELSPTASAFLVTFPTQSLRPGVKRLSNTPSPEVSESHDPVSETGGGTRVSRFVHRGHAGRPGARAGRAVRAREPDEPRGPPSRPIPTPRPRPSSRVP